MRRLIILISLLLLMTIFFAFGESTANNMIMLKLLLNNLNSR